MLNNKRAPIYGTELKIVPGIDEGYVPESEVEDTIDIAKATVVTSKVKNDPHNRHKIVLDIDLRTKLLESSTPGHYHLYIDKEIP